MRAVGAGDQLAKQRLGVRVIAELERRSAGDVEHRLDQRRVGRGRRRVGHRERERARGMELPRVREQSGLHPACAEQRQIIDRTG